MTVANPARPHLHTNYPRLQTLPYINLGNPELPFRSQMDIEPVTSSSPLSVSSPQSFQSAEVNHSPTVQQIRDDQPTFRRQVKLLPYELREHCMIYFEEGLCRLS